MLYIVENHVKFPLVTIRKKIGCFYPYFSSQLSYLLKFQAEKMCAVKRMPYLTSETHGLSICSITFVDEPITNNTIKNAKYHKIAITFTVWRFIF